MLSSSRFFLYVMVFALALPRLASATIVRLDVEFGGQSAGAVYLDLYETAAPNTVMNFLNYVDDGAGNRRYDGTFIHRLATGFVLQGGGYAYDPGLGPFNATSAPHIPQDAPIQNEFDVSRSNVRGTIAMAKLSGDPDSATSEWFINLADNSANLDTQNGGFTVFGRVLGNGMTLVDTIAAMDRVNLGGVFTQLPVVDSAATVDQANLITVANIVIDPPTVSVSPANLDFGLELVGSGPFARTLTVQNVGPISLAIGTIGSTDGLAAPFSVVAGQDNCSGRTLASETTCTFDVEFLPVVAGTFQDSFDVPSNDILQPSLTVNVSGDGAPLTPVLDASPVSLDFGSVGTGQPKILTVTVTNLGGGQLQPLSPSISGAASAAFTIAADNCSGLLLDFRQSCTLTVQVQSLAVGSLSAALDLQADPGGQTAQVALAANITLFQPDIELPESLDVGDTRFDSTGQAILRVKNNGIDPLYVSSIDVVGTDAALFSVADNCIDTAITVVSSVCSATVSFAPTATGTYNAVLRVLSNDPDKPVVTVPVTATASLDSDGVYDLVEQAGPNNGDGNRDGIPDDQQAEVASFPDVNGEYAVLETSVGNFSGIRAIAVSEFSSAPSVQVGGSFAFNQGFFLFTVENVPSVPDGNGGVTGGRAEVTLYLPPGQSANAYLKYGRLPSESLLSKEHWYVFNYDSATRTGAQFFTDRVVLHLVDGGAGDNQAVFGVDGRIVDPGGPALLSVAVDDGGGGGCALSKSGNQAVTPLRVDLLVLLAGLLLYRGTRRRTE